MDDSESKDPDSLALPLPDGAQVTRLGRDLALIELPLPFAEIPPALTEAEQDVALEVFRGATNREIADARGVSVRTVSKQLEAIYRKLGVSSRAELVLYLRRAPPAAS